MIEGTLLRTGEPSKIGILDWLDLEQVFTRCHLYVSITTRESFLAEAGCLAFAPNGRLSKVHRAIQSLRQRALVGT